MCGIITVRRLDKRDARSILKTRYHEQKGRGQQGFGFVALNKGYMVGYERAETETEIFSKLDKIECDEILFHHRFPTSTPNFEECAHPIRVSNPLLKYDWYVVHNGVIWDDAEHKEKHNELGFEYMTEIRKRYVTKDKVLMEEKIWNDSEALAIDVAIDLEAKQEGVTVRGAIAFSALAVDKVSKRACFMYWGRNSSPLVKFEVKETFTVFSSEGKGSTTERDILYMFDYETGTYSSKEYPVGPSRQKGYKDYSPKDYSPKDYSPKDYRDYDSRDHDPGDGADEGADDPLTKMLGRAEDPAFRALNSDDYSSDLDLNDKLALLYCEHDVLVEELDNSNELTSARSASMEARLKEVDIEIDELELEETATEAIAEDIRRY